MIDRNNYPYFETPSKVIPNLVVEHLLEYGDYIYVPERETILGYNGKCWVTVHRDFIRKRVIALLDDNIKLTHQEQILQLFLTRISRPNADETMQTIGYVNLDNGVLDLETKELLPHDKKYNFKSVLPISYNPDSKAPIWENFLNETTKGIDELKVVIQEIFGYCLVPGNKRQKFFILLGSGENGKSVLLNVLRMILGIENTSSLSMGDLCSKFKVEQLVNKLANICEESPTGKTIESEMLKNLSAGGRITVEQKFKAAYQIENVAKLIFASNSPILIKDHTHALFRRMMVIPFKYTVPRHKRDDHLLDKLELELSGILNWAIEGMIRLEGNNRFSVDSYIEEANNQFLKDTDTTKQFISDYCCIGEEYEIKTIDLYDAYKLYCKKLGHRPCANGEFGKRLLSYTTEIRNERESTGKRHYYYRGIDIMDKDNFRSTFNGESSFPSYGPPQ